MFGIGANELIIILIFGFLIFGPDKLPEIAKTVGSAIRKFRTAQEEMSKVIKTEVYDPEADDPFKNPLDALSKLENDAKREDKQESFSERKARYDKQRAARKAAQAKAEEKAKAEAEKKVDLSTGSYAATQALKADEKTTPATPKSGTSTAQAERTTRPTGSVDASKSTQKPPRKKMSAEEIYGTKKVARKPSKGVSAADAAGAKTPGSTPHASASGTKSASETDAGAQTSKTSSESKEA